MILEHYYTQELENLTESLQFKQALEKMKSLKDYSDTDNIKDILNDFKKYQNLSSEVTNIHVIESLKDKLLTSIKNQVQINMRGIDELGIRFFMDVNNMLANIKFSVERLYTMFLKNKGLQK